MYLIITRGVIMTGGQWPIMPRTRNEEIGEYTTNIRADDALDVFRGRPDRAKPLGSADIQEALGWSRGTVHNKLNELVERGDLETRTIGSRTRVWWEPIPRGGVFEEHRGIPTTPEDIRDWVDITARTEEVAQNRARAIYAAYELLRERKEAMIAELRDVAVETNPDDESNNPHGHWVNYLREALRPLPGTVPPGRGGTGESEAIWRFIDPDGELAEQLDVELDDWIATVETPGTDERKKHRRALLQMAYEYLQKEGEASKSDFKQALPSYTGQYTNFDGLWSYYLRSTLIDAPGVEYDGGGRHSAFKYTKNE
jgi:hypothetical protein